MVIYQLHSLLEQALLKLEFYIIKHNEYVNIHLYLFVLHTLYIQNK